LGDAQILRAPYSVIAQVWGTYSTDVNYCFKNHKAVCRVMRSESPHVDPWPMTGHNTSAIRSDERYDAAAKAAAVG